MALALLAETSVLAKVSETQLWWIETQLSLWNRRRYQETSAGETSVALALLAETSVLEGAAPRVAQAKAQAKVSETQLWWIGPYLKNNNKQVSN